MLGLRCREFAHGIAAPFHTPSTTLTFHVPFGRCSEGYGMNSGSRLCEPCEGTGYSWSALALVAVMIVSTFLLVLCAAKMWKAFEMKHLLRCAFQP